MLVRDFEPAKLRIREIDFTRICSAVVAARSDLVELGCAALITRGCFSPGSSADSLQFL